MGTLAYCGISSGSALFSETKLTCRERFLVNYNLSPLNTNVYKIDHCDLPASDFVENFIGPKRVNL